jgi:hypothetical protein
LDFAVTLLPKTAIVPYLLIPRKPAPEAAISGQHRPSYAGHDLTGKFRFIRNLLQLTLLKTTYFK